MSPLQRRAGSCRLCKPAGDADSGRDLGPGVVSTFFLASLAFGLRPALAQVAPAIPVAKSGGLGKGIGLELVGLGPAESRTRFGGAAGISIHTAVQIDLGARWAFRLPLSADFAVRGGEVAYGALALTPGAVYRWRSSADQRWIPYVGGGARLAAEGVRRDFVGLPIVVTSALDLGDHHHHFSGGADDPNVDSQLSLSPELWAGYEYHPILWIAVIFGAAYTWIRADGENVHLLRETIALRATL
jgi:hypothetical protein